MAKKVTAQRIASQCEWSSDKLAEFCADVFEDANFHNLCLAMTALQLGEYEVASEAILLERDQIKVGHLSEELMERRNALYERLKKARAALEKQPVASE